jgi:spore germination protein KB
MLAAIFVSALSPLIRRFPRTLAETAGRGAWCAVPLSLLPMLALLAAAFALFRRRPAGTGTADVFTELLGPAAGRALTGLYGCWFLFYAGFLLRSAADRFITTVYNGAGPALFVIAMALICALAAAGQVLPLGRTAMLLTPLMLLPMLLIALLTAKDLDLSLLLPLAGMEPVSVGAAALELANILSPAFFFGFLGENLSRRLAPRDVRPWLLMMLGLVGLMTVGCLGMFGPELTAKMRFPYFMLVRDLTVLGALERVEPVAVALWVFPDFLLVSLLLLLAARCLCRGLGMPPRRGYAPVCAAAAAAVALALPGEMAAFRFLSETLVPRLSAAFAFGPLPVLLALDALRKRRNN